MPAKQYFPTSHVATVESYPYGRKRTRAFFGTEFNPKKGFRSTFQTVNPDTGRLNAVKKSTYYEIMLMIEEEGTGHIKHVGTGIHGSDEQTNKAADFCARHFDLFTLPELQHIYISMLSAFRVSMVAVVQYCGAPLESVKPFYTAAIDKTVEALKAIGKGERVNVFADLKIDAEGVDKLKDPEYNPFTVTEYKQDESGQLVATVTKTQDPIRLV